MRAAPYQLQDLVGWLTLRSRYDVQPKSGAPSGWRWTCECKCGTSHDVSHENLRNGRVRACRKCAKAYRREESARIDLIGGTT